MSTSTSDREIAHTLASALHSAKRLLDKAQAHSDDVDASVAEALAIGIPKQLILDEYALLLRIGA